MNPRIAFLLLLSVVSVQSGSAESNLRAGASNGVVSHRQRRELSWWSSIFYLLLPPHPPHPDSSDSSPGDGSGSGFSGSSSTSTSGSGSGSGSDSDQEYIEGDTDAISRGDAVDESEMESYYLTGGSGNVNPAGGGSFGGVGVFAYIVAAMVATVVGAALVAMWKKRQAQKDDAVAPLGRFVEISSVRTPGSYSAPVGSARAARGSARV
ncbi:hypothetical protein ACHAW5_005249 [Stephanodiscus triporus]|uniref:Uncharacterized protein n=1 Tax=Stephanodiscus triporus TaxID=2934178 RepID=A0ABD3MTK7_9STRA